MRLFDLFEAELDATGWGATPMGGNVAYEGLRVSMKPSVFLWLAHQLDPSSVNPEVEKHMTGGGKIAHPFLQVNIPPEWEDGNFKKSAKVVGHEGRNRMTQWIKLKGDEPVEVQIFPRGGMRRHHITDDMIKQLASGMFNEDGDFTRGPLFDVSTALEEGWKDWVAGAAMAGAALGAQGKPHQAPKHATHAKPAVTQKAQINPNIAGSAIKVDPSYKEPTAVPKAMPKSTPQTPVQSKGQDVKSPAFASKLKQVAADLQVHPDDLLKVMHFETKGTLDPSITNRIGATGLIQFMPDTAKSLGTTVEALRKMSAVQQLDYVYKYFKTKIKPGFKASDIYLATLLPVALRLPDSTVIAQKGNKALVPHTEFSKNRMFHQNPAFAKPGKTHYTVGDIRDTIDKRQSPTIATLASLK
jgi:hypothetical protein